MARDYGCCIEGKVVKCMSSFRKGSLPVSGWMISRGIRQFSSLDLSLETSYV